ncbi:MAG: AAA family ATPase, partial [Saprospiraceae bacterium]
SETASLPEGIEKELRDRFESIILLYDNDTTGIRESQKLSKKHGLRILSLKSVSNDKDISDYFKNGGLESKFDETTQELVLSPEPIPEMKLGSGLLENHKFISGADLLKLSLIEIPTLWEPFFPKVGLGALVGSSDSGKSAFARQLAINIACGSTSFLGSNLNSINQKAIFISSEDDSNSTAFLINKQLNSCSCTDKMHNLLFLFESEENIPALLKGQLKEFAADLIIVDAYGDFLIGTDINNSASVREFLCEFSNLAIKNNCFVLFVHHLRKGTDHLVPSKHNALGSQGFEAKMRVVLELRTGDQDQKHLTILKGNYISRELKKSSLVLKFDESSLTYSTDGKRCDIGLLGENIGNKEKYEVDWTLIFEGKSFLKRDELLHALKDNFEIPYGTASKYIEKYCQKIEGKYATYELKQEFKEDPISL